MKPHST